MTVEKTLVYLIRVGWVGFSSFVLPEYGRTYPVPLPRGPPSQPEIKDFCTLGFILKLFLKLPIDVNKKLKTRQINPFRKVP